MDDFGFFRRKSPDIPSTRHQTSTHHYSRRRHRTGTQVQFFAADRIMYYSQTYICIYLLKIYLYINMYTRMYIRTRVERTRQNTSISHDPRKRSRSRGTTDKIGETR